MQGEDKLAGMLYDRRPKPAFNQRMIMVRFSPSSLLSTVAALFLAAVVGIVLAVSNERVTGLDWQVDENTVTVSGQVAEAAELKNAHVMTVASSNVYFNITPDDLIPEPDVLPKFAMVQEFMARQQRLADVLKAPVLTLILANGDELNVPLRNRHLSDLPIDFWLQIIAGFLGLMITAGVWSYKPQLLSARIFLISGVGFALLCSTLAYYSTRELAISELAFRIAHAGNRLGMVLLTYGGSALLWHYPSQLGKFPFGRVTFVVALLAWTNETMQWIDTPFHSYFDLFFICTTLSFVNGMLQWRRSKDQPLERAALRWLLLSFLISFSLIWLLYVLPIVLTSALQLDLVVASYIVLCVFLGIAVGISRYRIFDLERWWLAVWLWFLSGMLVFIVDIALITLLDIGVLSSLTLTILIVGWLYFPLRQRVLRRFMGRQSQPLKELLPNILSFMLTPHTREKAEEFWQSLLDQAIRPIQQEIDKQPSEQFAIEDDGMVLRAPSIDGQYSLELAGCDGGRRLFSHSDISVLQQCYDLIRFGEHQYMLREDATNRERERIMRDLHDDVGAKLLTLIHRVPDPYADMARSALTTLRETIFSLGNDNDRPLDEFMASLREECIDRCEAANCELHWQVPATGNCKVTAHVQINLSRVIRECMTNSLKHSQPKNIWITMSLTDAFEIDMHLEHDGPAVPVQNWQANNGMLNMFRRMNELAGTITFDDREGQGVDINLRFPVPL
nr:ATP-binding protein [Reinekea sp. G2M2-21]